MSQGHPGSSGQRDWGEGSLVNEGFMTWALEMLSSHKAPY